MNIRIATSNDAAIISEFNSNLAWESEQKQLDPDLVLDGVRALLADPAKGTYFVAEREGRIIGQLLITLEWSDWRNGMFWWIQSVYVAAEHRKQGIFRALYQHVHETVQSDPGVCGLRLYVEKDNHSARTTYERLGMHTTHYLIHELEFPRT